ncbi:hypothetical protein JCM12298_13350 [Desulfothermus naphthae]
MKKYINLRVIFVLFLLGSLVACSSKQEKIEEFISKGNALLKKGDVTGAILEFKNAVQLDPKSPRPIFYLAKAYLAKKDFRKAYGLFHSVLQLDPKYDEARLEISSLLLLARQPDKALENLKQLNSPEKFEPRFSILKARAYVLLKKYHQAIDVLYHVKQKDNKNVQMLFAICYHELGKEKEMLEALYKWRKIAPLDPGSYIFLARYKAAKGDKKGVEMEIEKMVKVNPSDKNRAILGARVLESLGLKKEAEKIYESFKGDKDLLKAKALFYMRHKLYDKAEKVYKELLKIKDLNDIEPPLMLAELYVNTRRADEALDVINDFIKRDLKKEDKEKLLLAKARVIYASGDINKAKEICLKILKQNQAMIEAHYLVGEILLKQGDFEKAQIHLNQVVASEPTNTKARILLARSLIFDKKELMAEDVLKRGLKINSENISLCLELARFYIQKKRYTDALDIVNKGLAKKENIALLRLRGELYVMLKKYKEAESDFKKIIKLQSNIPLGYMEMGRLKMILHNENDALKWFKKAYNTKKGMALALPAVLELYMRKDKTHKKAIEFLKDELKKNNSPLLYYYLGRIFLIKKEFEKAKQAFTQATILAPKWFLPYRGLAEVYLKQGKTADAISNLKGFFKKSKSISAGFTLAVLYEYNGQYKEAEQIYNELFKKYGEQPSFLNNLAYLYSEYSKDVSELKKADELINKALAKDTKNPYYIDTKAWIQFKLGNLDSAWEYIQEALNMSKEIGILNYHAAIIAHKLGYQDKAKEYLKIAMTQKLNPKTREEAMKLYKKWK